MSREEFRSERHFRLDADYPPERTYCACKQGRAGQCSCAVETRESRWWVPICFAVAVLAGLGALASAGWVPK